MSDLADLAQMSDLSYLSDLAYSSLLSDANKPDVNIRKGLRPFSLGVLSASASLLSLINWFDTNPLVR